MGAIHFYALLCLLLNYSHTFGILGAQKEPMCLSRFDYEYKVLSKLVELESELNKAKEEQTVLRTSVESLCQGQQRKCTGNTFIRWGRRSCPGNGTRLIYEGYAGGSFYKNKGGAANYLCLTKEPLWNKFDDKKQGGAVVYGAEYEIGSRDSNAFYGIPAFDDQNVPCAACHTSRASTIMIPGRNRCFDGWTLEYHGYLVGGNYEHEAASEFVCLDGKPEIIPGSSAQNGKLFFFSEARCGSLHCPPYVNGRELTCAVCSK